MARQKFTKQELRHDAFAEGLAKFYGFLQERFLAVVAGVLILAVLVLGVIWVRHNQEQTRQEASQRMYQATQQYNAAAYSQALISFEELSDRYARTPEGRSAVYYAGACHLALGENDAAVVSFRKYLDAEPDGFYVKSARYGLGLALEASGKFEEATTVLASLIDGLEPGDPLYGQARMAQSRVLEKLGRMDEAISVLEPLVQSEDFQARQEAESRIAVLRARQSAAS